MPKYFPFLRGRRTELTAVRELASEIAESNSIIPIIEPVNNTQSTMRSLEVLVDASMPFLFICNPIYGKYRNDRVGLRRDLITPNLKDYANWTPALYLDTETRVNQIRGFFRLYGDQRPALIYYGLPRQQSVLDLIEHSDISWHVFIGTNTPRHYMDAIENGLLVRVQDRFVKAYRNADYPARDFFTDMNTLEGNPNKDNFGDFSIVGDYYSETGGAAHAVTLHHMHYHETSSDLYVSHFVSDHTQSSAQRPAKTLEALRKLVRSLRSLQPNDTYTCEQYRQLHSQQQARSLEVMKRLAIKHHLEIMLDGGLNDLCKQ